MRRKYLTSIIITLCAIESQCQVFNLDSLKAATTKDTTTFVYMTALWCSPCLEKIPYYEAYFKNSTKRYKLIYLFDRDGFSTKKLNYIFPFINFTNRVLFMSQEFYSKATIQINSHRKMFQNFISTHEIYNPPIQNLKSFNLASFIALNSMGQVIIFDSPSPKGLSREQMDSTITQILKF